MSILVIDLGSSSIRALLFDDQAQAIPGAVSSRKHAFSTTPPGAAVAAADSLRSLTEACLDQILTHPAAAHIQAVGMDTFVGNMLGLDQAGRPITPVYTYADTQSSEAVSQLRPLVDEAASHQRTGCLLHPAYHPPKLHWLQHTAPALFSQVDQWLDIGTYLYRCWFGQAPCSYSVASWSGLLNRDRLAWDADWLNLLGLSPASFAPLSDYTPPLRGLTPAYARRWPLLSEVPFFLAVGDGAAANLGVGAVSPASLALTVGTTAAVRLVSTAPHPAVPPGLWGYRLDAAHHLIGGATSEGGNVFQWATQTLRVADDFDLEAQLQQAHPDGHGLTVLPLLAGERSPGWASQATGSFVGLRLSTSPFDLLQAVLEAVALRLGIIADQLGPLAESGAEVYAGGGALMASPAWAQIITNALNRPLHLVAEAEATARGVALLVLRALNQMPFSRYPPHIAQTFYPQAQAVTALRAARVRQMALYDRLIGPKPPEV